MNSSTCTQVTESDRTGHQNEPKENRRMAFFGFLRKQGSQRNRGKKTELAGSNQKITLVTEIPASFLSRRIVKAVKPTNNEPHTEESTDDVTDVNESDDVTDYQHPLTKLGIVQEELEKEQTEKWRKDRIDISMANRKEKKDREVMDHRRRMINSDTINDSLEKKTCTDNLKDKILPSVLSVLSQYPEHKRTVREASLPIEMEPSVKKSKFSAQDETNISSDSIQRQKEAERHWNDTISSLAKSVLPVTAVAVIAVVMIKLLRRW